MDTAAFERDRLALFARHGFHAQSRWLQGAGGSKTYALVREGADTGPATLLVHGGLAEASVWHAMAARLPGTVVIPDRPGHGLSDFIDYTGRDYRREAVEWMLHVVDSLGERQVDLVGNSMGGYFCLVFALAYPERVRRLALAGAPAGIDRELPLFLRAWGRPIAGRLVSAMISGMKDPEKFRTQVLAPMLAHPERVPADALAVAIAAATKPGWHLTARSMLRAVSDFGGWRPRMNIREEVARLSVPTLFAWGDVDNFAPPASGEQLARRMQSAELEIVARAGHLPQLDQPAALAERIAAFFDRSDLRAPSVTQSEEHAAG